MKQFIKCPYCGSIELGEDFVHNCLCGEYIQGSQWQPLKALSIKQPWAWLIVNGYKDLENRDTLKNFRGDFLIHASKGWDEQGFVEIHNSPQSYKMSQLAAGRMFIHSRREKGGIIGHATITASITESNSPWFIGKNAFVIEKPQPLEFTPCKGALGFFNPKI